MKKIILITLSLSAFLWADFTRDDVNNTVTDNTTKLMWQDDDNGTVTGTGMAWEAAITHCEALTLGGYDDWRLPNFNELYSIADRSTSNPSIDAAFINFEFAATDYYWSSTSIVSQLDTAWVVHFGGGYSNVDPTYATKSNINFVRCVRGGI